MTIEAVRLSSGPRVLAYEVTYLLALLPLKIVYGNVCIEKVGDQDPKIVAKRAIAEEHLTAATKALEKCDRWAYFYSDPGV